MPDLNSIEHELRERFPEPSKTATAQARAAVLASLGQGESARRSGRRSWRRVVAVVAITAVVGAAFAVGYAIASARAPKAAAPPANSSTGPGFLPSAGWYILENGISAAPLESVAAAANVPFAAADRGQPTPTPIATVASLPRSGIVIWVQFPPRGGNRSIDRTFPPARLPLRVSDATAINPPEGFSCPPAVAPSACFKASGSIRAVQVSASGYDLGVWVFFGTDHPSTASISAANEELAQLSLPGCPAAEPLSPDDGSAAARFTLGWLRVHYFGHRRDLRGARATAATVPPRSTDGRFAEVAVLCGASTDRILAVGVTLPPGLGRSNLGPQLLYFLAKTQNGWVIWRHG